MDVRAPLTARLGLSIAGMASLHTEGTGGLYLMQGGDSKNVLLVTARHVLFPPNARPNYDYPRPRTVHLLVMSFFWVPRHSSDNLLKSIRDNISEHHFKIPMHEYCIKTLKQKVDGVGKNDQELVKVTKEVESVHHALNNTKKVIKALEMFHEKVKTEWRSPKQRVIGHVVCAPPLMYNADTQGFSEDYALVELDSTKFKKAFHGNCINLGNQILILDFVNKMYTMMIII
ncbi:hypothetical protein H2248_007199 [Termitomyces sp. 'cryptogamus']|nr:hypothetical protein H2248_007199 [Termitomyces sp. 'cryptogamus']